MQKVLLILSLVLFSSLTEANSTSVTIIGKVGSTTSSVSRTDIFKVDCGAPHFNVSTVRDEAPLLGSAVSVQTKLNYNVSPQLITSGRLEIDNVDGDSLFSKPSYVASIRDNISIVKVSKIASNVKGIENYTLKVACYSLVQNSIGGVPVKQPKLVRVQDQ